MKLKNPCHGCPKVGCGAYHDICPDYIKFKAWRIELNRKKTEDYEVRTLSRDQEIKYRKNLKAGIK